MVLSHAHPKIVPGHLLWNLKDLVVFRYQRYSPIKIKKIEELRIEFTFGPNAVSMQHLPVEAISPKPNF